MENQSNSVPSQNGHRTPQDLITPKDAPDEAWKTVMPNVLPEITATTKGDLRARKYIDQARWACVQRPCAKRRSVIGALASCYNYLYSCIGARAAHDAACAARAPLTQARVCEILGFPARDSPADQVLLPTSEDVVNYFAVVCAAQGVEGAPRGEVFFKVRGKDWTPHRTDVAARDAVFAGLRDVRKCYVYRSFDAYLFVVGYEIVPTRPLDAYKRLEDIEARNLIHHLYLAETDISQRVFWEPSWEHVCRDLSAQYPQYFDIREAWKEDQVSADARLN